MPCFDRFIEGTSVEEPEAVDGRVMRGARNRAFIMDAIFELVQEGEIFPTAERVARQAVLGQAIRIALSPHKVWNSASHARPTKI